MPAAPPSWAFSGTAASRARASTTPTSQPAAFSPNVVGTACWSSVRAGHRRRAVLLARAARTRAATPSSSVEDQPERALRDEHRRGVHDVLARRAVVDVACRVAADARAQRADERLRRIADRAAVAGELRRIELARAARASRSPSAASAGMTPRDASAAASARSTSSIASTHAPSDTASASRLGHEDRGEDGQCAKKTVARSPCIRMSQRSAPSSCLRDERRPVRRRPSARQHRVRRVRLGLVREVDARQLVAEQAAREDEDVEPRRLSGQRVRLRDDEREAPVSRRCRCAPSACPPRPTPRSSRRRSASPAPSSSCPISIVAPGSLRADELVLRRAREPDRVVRPDRLRGSPRQAS